MSKTDDANHLREVHFRALVHGQSQEALRRLGQALALLRWLKQEGRLGGQESYLATLDGIWAEHKRAGRVKGEPELQDMAFTAGFVSLMTGMSSAELSANFRKMAGAHVEPEWLVECHRDVSERGLKDQTQSLLAIEARMRDLGFEGQALLGVTVATRARMRALVAVIQSLRRKRSKFTPGEQEIGRTLMGADGWFKLARVAAKAPLRERKRRKGIEDLHLYFDHEEFAAALAETDDASAAER